MPYTGEYHPNWGEIGTDLIPQGSAGVEPYGLYGPAPAAPSVSTASMQQSGVDSATSNIGYRPESGPQRYRPEAGRADRLAGNVVGGMGSYGSQADGGYSGMYRGAGLSTNK